MNRAGVRRSVLVVSLLSLVHAGGGMGPARGADVPPSAQSDAMLYPAPLLDQPALVFRFPQLVTRYESQLFMTSDAYWSTDLVAGGALGRFGNHGGFLLIKDRDPWTTLGGTYGLSGLGSRAFQGGFGSAWGSFRAGIALLGSLEGGEDVERDTEPYNDRLSQSYNRFRDDLLELGTGFGWGNDRTRIDGALEISWLDQSGTDYSLTRQDDTPDEYWRLRFEREKEPLLTAALRAGFPLGSKGEAVFAGYWAEEHSSWTGATRSDVDTLLKSHPYVDNWGVEAAVAWPLPKVDWFAVSASYRNLRKAALTDAYLGWTTRATTSRTGYVGLSLRKKIMRSLQGYAGIRGVYQLSRFEERRDSWIRRYSVSREWTDEDFDGQAAWGMSYVWKDLRLMGKVSSTLELSRPFVSMDASFRL